MPKIPRAIVDEMIAHAVEEAAKTDKAGFDGIEACGVIHARDGVATSVHRVTNVDASRHTYRMDPQEDLALQRERDQSGDALFAIYHSHVASPAYPSPTDRRQAFFPPLAAVETAGLAPEEIVFPEADPDRLIYPDAYYVLLSLQHAEPDVRAYKIGGDALPVEHDVEIV